MGARLVAGMDTASPSSSASALGGVRYRAGRLTVAVRRTAGHAPRRVRVVVGVLVIAMALSSSVGSSPAQDRSRSAAEVVDLAREAVTDDRALADLRATRRVDGRPVDLRAATAGIDDPTAGAATRRARLDALVVVLEAGGGPSPTSSKVERTRAEQARGDAHDVVTGRDYREQELPRPFRGPLRWLGDRLAPVGRFLDRVVGPVLRFADRVPGGRFLLLGVVLGLVVAAVVRVAARRGAAVRTAGPGGGGLLVDPAADPDELSRQADAAEAAGDFALAVRRRYEEGLLRLVGGERLVLRLDTTPRRAADEVGGPTMTELTTTFEEVVYGDRPASADDARAARTGWLDVLGAKARR